MLGNTVFKQLFSDPQYQVWGTLRSTSGLTYFPVQAHEYLLSNIDVLEQDSLVTVLDKVRPDVVINCVGLIKHHSISKQHSDAVKINALLPHDLAKICDQFNAKLIHFSTDCVFTGDVGLYSEDSLPDARDLYGKSKSLGEVDYGKHLTLRTSIIGHELMSSVSLVDWFLSQVENTKGFSKAIFSGLPTCYIAKLLAETIFPNPEVIGLLHLSVDPIDKYTLLKLIAKQYQKNITIHESQDLVIDRSLNSNEFRRLTQFIPPSWNELIEYMHADYLKRYIS